MTVPNFLIGSQLFFHLIDVEWYASTHFIYLKKKRKQSGAWHSQLPIYCCLVSNFAYRIVVARLETNFLLILSTVIPLRPYMYPRDAISSHLRETQDNAAGSASIIGLRKSILLGKASKTEVRFPTGSWEQLFCHRHVDVYT